jgi:hypothetical protein
MASASEESYERLYVISSHSEVAQPIAQVPVPPNMTVTTPCNLNEVATGYIPNIIDMFRPLFKKITHVPAAFGNITRDVWIPPTGPEIKHALMQLRSQGNIGAIRSNTPVDSVFTQRKNEAPFTRQMCFMPGSDVMASITEFSKDSPDGVNITNHLIRSSQVDIYRPANRKDEIIINIEKRLMDVDKKMQAQQTGTRPPFVACTSNADIVRESRGEVSEEDIANLHANRRQYCHAIGLQQPPAILCSFDIDRDVEPLRLSILSIIKDRPRLVNDFFTSQTGNDETIKSIIKTLKLNRETANLVNPLVSHLIFSLMNGINRHGGHVSDPKIVQSGYEQIPSDELLRRIHALHPHDPAYVFILGCRCIQTSDPLLLSRARSSGTQDQRIEYFGGKRMRMRRTMKRKLLRKFHKRKLHKTPKRTGLYRKKITRSQRR